MPPSSGAPSSGSAAAPPAKPGRAQQANTYIEVAATIIVIYLNSSWQVMQFAGTGWTPKLARQNATRKRKLADPKKLPKTQVRMQAGSDN